MLSFEEPYSMHVAAIAFGYVLGFVSSHDAVPSGHL